MKKRVLNLMLWTGLLLLASCAGKKHYEWIKIKPPGTSNEYIAHSTTVKSVDILVRLTEKANYQYIADSRAFFAKYPLSDSGELLSDNQRTSVKNKKLYNVSDLNNSKQKSVLENDVSISKLNKAIILPKKLSSGKTGNGSVSSDDKLKTKEKSFSIKELFPGFNDASKVEVNLDKKGDFIWAGLILIIIGILSGLIFGRYTYFISVGGILLIIIGYYLRM